MIYVFGQVLGDLSWSLLPAPQQGSSSDAPVTEIWRRRFTVARLPLVAPRSGDRAGRCSSRGVSYVSARRIWTCGHWIGTRR